jgi:hypothetical protein
VIVCFVDIGGIDDHHFLSFLFILIQKLSYRIREFNFLVVRKHFKSYPFLSEFAGEVDVFHTLWCGCC